MKSNRASFNISNFAEVLVLAFFLCVLCGNSFAQAFKTIHPGVEYARVDHKLGNDPVKINLLRLDLTKVRLDVHHALDKAIGTETTSSIATRHRAIAAINAGFFRLDKSTFAGDAAGALQIDGNLLSESSNNRAGIAITNTPDRTLVGFFNLRTSVGVSFGVDHHLLFDGINRERKSDEIILFTPEFAPTTKTDLDGSEIVITRCREMTQGSHRCGGGVLLEGRGDAAIPKDGFVISIGKDAIEKSIYIIAFTKRSDLRSEAGHFRIGSAIRPVAGPDFFSAFGYEDVTNGVPQLIKNSKIEITWEQEKASKSFVETRHPRTAVANMKDGKFLMVTVDGRQPGVSVGMSLYELADYLLSIGATDAMNLDGGGSTTMFLDGKVVNTPSDKEGERKVGDALLVTLRKNTRR